MYVVPWLEVGFRPAGCKPIVHAMMRPGTEPRQPERDLRAGVDQAGPAGGLFGMDVDAREEENVQGEESDFEQFCMEYEGMDKGRR